MEDGSTLLAVTSFATSLQGQAVEINGLTGKVKLWSRVHGPTNEEVDGVEQNGKTGRVQYGSKNSCVVRTSDGLVLLVPRENLLLQPIDFDVLCPTDMSSVDEAGTGIVKSIGEKGYCVMLMSGDEEMRKSALTEASWFKADFVRPYPEFETQYLGKEASSKIVRLDGRLMEGAVGYYMQSVADVCGLLTPVASSIGFEPSDRVGSLMLRQEKQRSEEDQLNPGWLTDELIREGEVEKFIDFARRRRLCVMQVIECDPGTSVILSPKNDVSDVASAAIPLEADKLLIFRHDLFEYSYGPASLKHLILQGWLMEEHWKKEVAQVTGSYEEVSTLIGGYGAKASTNEEVHCMSLSCLTGGDGVGFESMSNVYMQNTDIFISIPKSRWDHDLYYSDVLEAGKALCKHSGFMGPEAMDFDHDFFGVTLEEAKLLTPVEYGHLRCMYETLHLAGWTMETLKNQFISIGIGGAGKDTCFCERLELLGNDRFTANIIETQVPQMLLGLKGRTLFVDTACSASNVATQLMYQDMRIARDAMKNHGRFPGDANNKSVCAGGQFFNVHVPFIGLSQAHMLGITGRSKTYDMSANGYARSEGFGAKYLCLDSEIDKSLDKIIDVVGGCINQDGRSASLTAPNGPSQTLTVKWALQSANRQTLECNITETHGTGTALGDPIEVGSVKAAMNPGRTSENNIGYQAGKSMTGHLETCAGTTGIIKNILAVMHGCFWSNCHLRELNSNIDEAGYAAFWPDHLTVHKQKYIYVGVSSFGFGGTNCRTEMWGHPTRGARKISPMTALPSGDIITRPFKALDVIGTADALFATCPKCSGSMCWLCGEADEKVNLVNGRHRCSKVRDDAATSYEFCSMCYKGGYQFGGKEANSIGDLDLPMYIVGSWTNWTEYEKMTETSEGSYVYAVTLGDTRCERFLLSCEANDSQAVYPIVTDGAPFTRVEGPDGNSGGRSWLIDGASRNTAIGTVYKIEYKLDESGNRSITWEPVITEEEIDDLARILGRHFPAKPHTFGHSYSISGSWTAYRPQAMVQSKSNESVWETTFKLGIGGRVDFNIVRNGSFDQAIYPASVDAKEQYIPVMGPDAKHENKRWLVDGVYGELVTIQLCANPGTLSLTLQSKSEGRKFWNSPVIQKARYFIVGSHNNWGTLAKADADYEMLEDVYEPGLFSFDLTLGQMGWHDFQIIVDKDWYRILHPHRTFPLQKEMESCLAQGPHGDICHGLNWTVAGPVGKALQIVLDVRSDEKGPSVYFRNAQVPSITDA